MDNETNTLEALKLVSDWSKWLISIETGAIAIVGAVIKVGSDTNIWLTRDRYVGRLFHMNTQGLATLESFFFGAGMICFSALIVAFIWLPTVP